jgi:hypothetical protein
VGIAAWQIKLNQIVGDQGRLQRGEPQHFQLVGVAVKDTGALGGTSSGIPNVVVE